MTMGPASLFPESLKDAIRDMIDGKRPWPEPSPSSEMQKRADALRLKLVPCHDCGADPSKLRFHTWHVGAGAHVWCSECGFGSPEKHHPELIANTGDGDGPAEAARLWNAYGGGL